MATEPIESPPDLKRISAYRPATFPPLPLRMALESAVMAPSTHNTQPWRFRLGGEHVDLLADRTRSLPIADPHDRELTISCGACLLHLRVALRHVGWNAAVTSIPDPAEPDLLATVRLGTPEAPTAADEALFDAISSRHTSRSPFRETQVGGDMLAQLQAAAATEGASLHLIEGKGRRLAVAHLVADADRMQTSDIGYRRELAGWVHPNRSVRTDGLPGSVFGLGDTLSYAGPFALRSFDWGPIRSAHDRRITLGSPVLAVLVTPGDRPDDWLDAGQALGRLWLHAAANGVMASFLNQPIELPELRPSLARAADVQGCPQLLLRLGYAETSKTTPRRPVSDVLVRASEDPR